MEKTTITVFVADCGKKYQSRGGCLSHEKVCKCFTNQKYKACHSCKFNGGLEKEDGERYRNCLHKDWDYDRMKPYNIPNTVTFDCINCPLYEPIKPFSGKYEQWEGYAKKNIDDILPLPNDLF